MLNHGMGIHHMSKAFEVKLSSDPNEVIAKAKVAARDNGVNFEGDSQTGHFSGHGIEGSYLILENNLAIQISKKPFIMPWSMIETTLRKYFA
jgi:hypothetical protein